ncbi:phospholipid-transporting ATPase ID isoform X4 [Drosophila grimshawi]|uniref:phospholipid-transporting ATPase ID isoform X4 n=1 Tax=Drosophila grimshawi TaxID=7222 RepID=UPI000C871266|nr:phospholipid-transporting ATPase ID isoform X4 [Drosophila grimshawi]
MSGARKCNETEQKRRQRPDTLELSVLHTCQINIDDEGQLQQTDAEQTATGATGATGTGATGTGATGAGAVERRTRWFHFARKSRRRRMLICEEQLEQEQQLQQLQQQQQQVRLAQPETMNIGNSTLTIATPLAAQNTRVAAAAATTTTTSSIVANDDCFYSVMGAPAAPAVSPAVAPAAAATDSAAISPSEVELQFKQQEQVPAAGRPRLSMLQRLVSWRRSAPETLLSGRHNSSSRPSCELEQPLSTSASARNLRRLSQMRRRRSSYYFSDNERRIRANDKDFNSQFKYHNNYIKTSKYSLLTFLPFNLLEQFQRLANFYFLCLLVLQLIPAISSLTPVTTAIPLIGVLTLTAVKDAYDDIQRHLSDSQVNNRKSKTLRNGKLIEAKWSEVQVGDVIRLDNNQFVAADILLLTTSEPNGLCFIETAELDGETNLKAKQCLTETTELGEQHDLLWDFKGEIICERPNNLLNKFDGTLIWKNQRFALDNDKILLRGCVLRNTQWCYGLVVFAGVDTKLMQNSGKTQFKSTGVDRLLNFIIIGIVLFLVSICAFFAVGSAIWEGLIGQHFQLYLPWEHIIPQEMVASGATVIGLLVFFSYAIVLNTVVPISLYVSVEVIRFVQSFLINWDEEMYYARTQTYAKARTTTLNEELGQIQYIFSDKTGTLTQNIMTFNKCSINGRTYGDVIDMRTGEPIQISEVLEPIDFSANPHYETDFRWYDRTLLDAVRSDERHAQNFFRLLALCHTVMAETVDGRLEYQAQSPDEAALVSAARNFGFVFRSRTPNSITIEVMGSLEEYELLHILDFNNVRKRMSVILRRSESVVLYCKGADNVIYDRLHGGQEDMKARTQDHLNKFAGEGLRTLVLAERQLSKDYYNDWRLRHQEASLSMDSREQKLNAIYEEIESDMDLLGVTAIEDKLQDGVPKSISNLQNAGIKIWVLTGDKQETAINIGYSCQLLTDELVDVFIVDGSSVEEVEKQLRQFKESIKIFDRFRPGGIDNYNGESGMDPLSVTMTQTSAFMQDSNGSIISQPPPAISVVTFRWDAKIKDNKGGPDSAECQNIFGDGRKSVDGRQTPAASEVDESTGFALVVNGHSLVHCLSPELETKFLDIASNCKAVICCRVTPLQKALVVELIKRAKNAVTLAIGDGANDVSMIKAAHIGVGISGQEGLQAVLSSDYAIAQFCYLERLLLVHGRWSYYRMCKFLRYFFYKNFAFTLCHCWYSLFCGFSAQTVFDPMFISVYNLFYTSLPVLALGVFEQDVSDKDSVEYPILYTPGLKSELFNIREFIYSVLHGAFTSLILFLIPYGVYKDGVSHNGYIVSDHMTLGAVVATILIVDNTAQIALYTSYWTIVNHITIWGSLIWYFVLDYFYNYVIGGPYVGSLTQAIKDVTFWVTMIITVVMLMAPVLAYKFYLVDVHPSLSDKIRQKSLKKMQSRVSSDVRRTPSSRRGRRSVRSGYAFAHQEGFGRLITSGKIMHKQPKDFAFPLGLGTKKTQALHNNLVAGGSVGGVIGKQMQTSNGHTHIIPHSGNNNNYNNNNNDNTNTNQRHNHINQIHSSMADIRSDGYASVDMQKSNGGSDDLSPRAPCQDLDTINL